MRRLLPLAVSILLLPGIVLAAAPTPTEQAQLARIELQTQQIRQLQPKLAVKTSFLGNTAFDQIYAQLNQQDTPAGEIDLGQRESVLLGLLSKKDNLRKILFSQSASQVLGLYDFHTRLLYVRNNDNEAFGPERYVIAHEYTHALQDQHYDLAKLQPDQYPLTYRNSDAVAAHHALIEGDAVTTELLFIHQTYGKKDLAALIKLESQPSNAKPLPKAFDREFHFPYTTGVDFVETLYAKNGVPGIAAAYRRLPQSTYEIMHPSAYLHGWKPATVDIHSVQGFADWQQVDDDVFGVFGYDLLIWQFLGRSRADKVTTSYRGDRYLFLEKGADSALLLDSVWTNHAAALAARDALVISLHARFKHAHVSSRTAVTVGTGTMGIYLQATGDKLVVAYAPSMSLATQLGTAPTN